MSYTINPSNDVKQVNGSAITAVSTKVNGGTVSSLGSLASDSVITAKTNFGEKSSIYGSQIVVSATTGISKAYVGGTVAKVVAGVYVIRGQAIVLASKYTGTGFGSAITQRSINKLEAMRTERVSEAIRAGYWDIYSGTWSTAPTAANDIASFGADHAATPSLAVPGELVYKTSGNPGAPTQDDYKAKTG